MAWPCWAPATGFGDLSRPQSHCTFLGAAELQGFASSPSESSVTQVLAEKNGANVGSCLGWKRGEERAGGGGGSLLRISLLAVQGRGLSALTTSSWVMLTRCWGQQEAAEGLQGKGRAGGAPRSVLLEEGCCARLLPGRIPEGRRTRTDPALNAV